MNELILSLIMCPITKEKLTLCTKNELNNILDNKINVIEEKNYLINESKTYLYPVSHTGYPILLPEEAIPISINSQHSDLFSLFKEHKQNLENVYKKIDFKKNPFAESEKWYIYWRTAITKPLVENLIPGSILDAGGGFGFFRRFTKGRFHLNLDVSEEMLNNDNSPDKILGRTESIPLLSNSFDNIVCIGSIEHSQDVKTTLSELVRCLKPKGKFLLASYSDDWPKILSTTPWAFTYCIYLLETYYLMFKQNPMLFVEKALGRLNLRKTKTEKAFKPLWGGEDQRKIQIRRFNPNTLEEMLTKAGLRVLKKGRCGKNFPGKISPPRKIIDHYFNSMKYGQYLFFVCEK